MTPIAIIYRKDFDNLENHHPETVEEIAIVVQHDKNVPLHRLVGEWLESQPPFKLYFGYNGLVYPKIRVKFTSAIN